MSRAGRSRRRASKALAPALALIVLGTLASAAPAAPGDIDLGFGAGGKVTTDFGGADSATALAVQGDGKIVLAGYRWTEVDFSDELHFAVARFHPDGSPDTTFSGDGMVTVLEGPHSEMDVDVAIQPDGRILVAGGFATIVRLAADGSLDKSFSGDGKASASPLEVATAVGLQPDGKIVVAGGGEDATGLQVARFNPSGTVDKTFSGDGLAGITSSPYRADDVAVQPDGKILVAGGEYGFELARFDIDGSPDESLSDDGYLTTSTLQPVGGMTLAADGRIVLAGGGYYTFASRYLPSGSPDPGFGSGGLVEGQLGGDANGLAVEASGKVVVAGHDGRDFALIRFNADGSPDTSFGGDGSASTDIGNEDTANDVATDIGGNLLVAGEATPGSDRDFALVRYQGGDVSMATPPVPRRPTIRGRPGRARVSKRRTFRLKTIVSCPGAGPACKVRVKVRAKARKRGRLRAIQVGGGRFTIPAGGSRRLKARLSPRGMGLLRARGRLVVLVRVRVARGESSVSKALRAKLLPGR